MVLESLRRRLSPAHALLIPLALAVASYARALNGQFVFDDTHTVFENLAIKHLATFLREHFLQGFAIGGRPVTDLTLALNYAVGRLEPWNFHVTSLAIHLAVVALAWGFARAVCRLAGAERADWIAVAAAGLFAVHPLQSESVAYVSQRSEALASGFYLATLSLLLAGERRGLTRRGAPFFVAALATFALAIGSKTIVVSLPAAWLILVAVVPSPERRAELLGWRARLLALIPFALLDLAVMGNVLFRLEGASDAGFALPGLSPLSYLLTQLRVVVVYLRLLVWPAGQNADWDFPVSGAGDPWALLAGLFLLALAGGAIGIAARSRDRSDPWSATARLGAFGVLWFFAVLSVTSSFVPLLDVFAEHRVYLAALGIFLALAALGERLLSRLPPPRQAAAGLLALLAVWGALAVALHRRNAVWETQLAFWSDCAAKAPLKARARMSVCFVHHEEGRYQQAIADCRRALELTRGDAGQEVLILQNLATALLWLGRTDEAIEALQRAAKLDKGDPLTFVDLAAATRIKKDFVRARIYAQWALELDPKQGDGWNVLGAIQLDEGDAAGALASFSRAEALDPDDGVRPFNVGRALEKLGDRAGACGAWRRALAARLTPGLRTDVQRRLALARCGQ